MNFDQVLKLGYNPEQEKQRIDVYDPPIIFSKLRMIIPKYYSISRTESQIIGTKLGLAKIQYDDRIKELLHNVPYKLEESSDLEFLSRANLIHFPFSTIHKIKYHVPVLDWVYDSIYDLCEVIGLSQSQVVVVSYLIGLKDALNLQEKGKLTKDIDSELVKFWEYIDLRQKEFNYTPHNP